MFIETCTRPRSESAKPFARTAGSPPSLSRIAFARRLATPTSAVRRFTFHAIKTGRAPPMHAPAVGWSRAGPKSGFRSGFVSISAFIWTSRIRAPATEAIAAPIASTMSLRRPSEKFGTHSTTSTIFGSRERDEADDSLKPFSARWSRAHGWKRISKENNVARRDAFERGGDTTGHALDRSGAPLPLGTPIRTFVDGVDYSNGPSVSDAQGSFAILTTGNTVTSGGASETTSIQEGANLGDTVIYAAGDFSTATDVLLETSAWSPGSVLTMDVHVGSAASTPEPLKLQGIVARPARGGSQYVFLCNPTAGVVSLADYYLEVDRPGTYHGPSLSLTGTIPAQSPLRVNLSLPLSLIPTGDALKLVYRNPGGAGATAGGGDIVVDRVEFNRTSGGTLTWEPGNTILGDAPAPTVGRILERDAACTDSNSPQDFSLGIEPGLPANQPPTLTIQSPTDGQTFQAASAVTFAWTMSDDIFMNADLLVWANVTIGNVTTPLLAAAGATSVVWTAPDIAVDGVVVHVDVVDPFGAKASASRTFNLTRQTPFAILIAVLIAAVLFAFLVYGLLRARKKEQEATARPPPAGPPQPSPLGPATVPPAAPAATASTKACPRCHTIVKAEDVACFFCGYSFTEGKPSP